MAKAQASGVKRPAARVTTLKRRPEFLRVRKGARWAAPAFVLEAKGREDDANRAAVDEPRFGFTVTRQIGKAVDRNRIRRRLRAALAEVVARHARRDFDYVLIARRPALTAVYAELVAELAKALDRVHRPPPPRRKGFDANTNSRTGAQDKSR
jgi:ribonuclease P protein component